jgi:hypothetical protein
MICCALLPAPAVLAENEPGFTIAAGSAEGRTGELIDIPVSFTGNPGVAAFSLKLNYDGTKLTPVSVSQGEALTDGSLVSNIQAEDGAEQGYVSAVWVNAADFTGDGAVFTVRFKITGEPGDMITVALEFASDGIVNQNLEEVAAKIADGAVTVTAAGAENSENSSGADGLPNAGREPENPPADIGPETPADGGRAEEYAAKTEESGNESWDNPFSDVRETEWFYEAVRYAYANGLMLGMSADRFEPGRPVSRAMFVTILHRIAGTPAADGGVTFTDVAEGQWYSAAVSWASANGIAVGDAGYFQPDGNISREQAAAILFRCAALSGGQYRADAAKLVGYADADQISEWARSAMAWAAAEGIITGRSEMELAPQGTASRAETAAILQRIAPKITWLINVHS